MNPWRPFTYTRNYMRWFVHIEGEMKVLSLTSGSTPSSSECFNQDVDFLLGWIIALHMVRPVFTLHAAWTTFLNRACITFCQCLPFCCSLYLCGANYLFLNYFTYLFAFSGLVFIKLSAWLEFMEETIIASLSFVPFSTRTDSRSLSVDLDVLVGLFKPEKTFWD